MGKISKHRVLVAGILAPLAAAFLGQFVYATLTRASADPDQDFIFRLTAVTGAMIGPFLFTVFLALVDRRRGPLERSAKAGLALATLSLGLAWLPLQGLIGRAQQARNLSIQDEAAPLFDAVDLAGKSHRLQDQLGKVVLINAWATWCLPCREEMPLLDGLYQRRGEEGLVVYGLSIEDAGLQRKFAKEVHSVGYPLLTVDGNVPRLYRDIQRWPAIFLIDRKGRLQPAPQAGAEFEKIEAAVDALLADKS
jgi:thiol-disulfide isomerase/thioredoxin